MNKLYSHLFIGVDLGPLSFYIVKRAIQISQFDEVKLSVLHVVEPSMVYTAHFSEQEATNKQALKIASQSLAALCSQFKKTQIAQLITVGDPQSEIIRQAALIKSDLIVVGNQGIGGYTHTMGSTAHFILNNAECDVLVVQVNHLNEIIAKTVPQQGEYLWQAFTQDLPHPTYVEHKGPQWSGSKHGFGENIKRGPRLTMRPAHSPYHGGTRENNDEEESK